MSRSGVGLEFYPEWRITLFVLVMVPVLVGLGFWQLQRAAEKASLAAAFDERQQQPPVDLENVWADSPQALAYVPVRLSGMFLQGKYFLLDNRINAGRFGYEVLGVMQLDGSNRLALVNRGWVAGDPARLEMPAVPPVPGRVELVGHVYVAPGTPYLLAEQQLVAGWPKVLQAVEMDKILPTLGSLGDGPAFRYPIRIAGGEPGALTVDWQVVNVSPQKHRAYAVQWFTMALVLLLFYMFRSSNLWQLLRRRPASLRG